MLAEIYQQRDTEIFSGEKELFVDQNYINFKDTKQQQSELERKDLQRDATKSSSRKV